MDRPKRSAAAVPSLPDDALVEILSRVPARSLCRFKCASKTWRDLITDRHHRKRLPQTLEGFFLCERDGDGGGLRLDPIRQGLFIDTLGRSMPLPSFSFLGELPGIEKLGLIDSCNGLFLFGHGRYYSEEFNSLGYVVCNPTTEQWVAVPSSSRKPYSPDETEVFQLATDYYSPFTYLIFDPAVSLHFRLVQFCEHNVSIEEVHTYSSETGVWCDRVYKFRPDERMELFAGSTFVSGMLHFGAYHGDQEVIVAVDGDGKKSRIVSVPDKFCYVDFLGQSQGRLHFIGRRKDFATKMTEVSIWVLQDYDTEEWVLKHSVTSLQLFGKNCQVAYGVVTIHPDRNLIFFVQHGDLKLKSYDMDSKEVCTLRTLVVRPEYIHPYVPCFAELPALANKP